MVQTEGLPSLYAGITVSLMRVVPACITTFVSFELIIRWLSPHMHEP